MHRIALQVAYNGRAFHGWQFQEGLRTVQGVLQEALARVARQAVVLTCAGRTDAGVHATGQVAHFDVDELKPERAWVRGVNSLLPPDLAVHWAGEQPPDFDARRSALARRYLYLIHNQPVRSPLFSTEMTQEARPLNAAAMHSAAQCLLGEHDFTSFRAAHCQARSPVRCLGPIAVRREGQLVVLDVEANAFLYHMVRNLAGALMEVGLGKREPAWLAELLAAKDRSAAPRCAPATGLYLAQVRYPPPFTLPQTPNFPQLLGPA